MLEDLVIQPDIAQKIQELTTLVGSKEGSLEANLVEQMILSSLKLLQGHDTQQIKLMTRALKEMSYAFRIFNGYPAVRKVSIFGSARTPPDHPDYLMAMQFSKAMAEKGWMCITGGAYGIMKAGLEGQTSDTRFGLAIRLPFESSVNELLEGDPKSIMFRYFFTRKLIFMTNSNALVAFPGGVGTMDELYEGLTLMQTGKGAIVPIVLMEGAGGSYWKSWLRFMEEAMLHKHMIDQADFNFFYIAPGVEEAVNHIEKFYKRYHSSRYVEDQLVIRIKTPLSEEQIASLNNTFCGLIAKEQIVQTTALPQENEFPELPRLVFYHIRRYFGLLRKLIDTINDF